MMEENFTPFLPQLKSDKQLQNFEAPGEWLERAEDVLGAISAGIEEANLVVDASEVQAAIPDVWARPLLFEIALYDTEHALHKRTKEEWRGLLAMIALKEVLELPLTVKEITIPRSENECGEDYLRVLFRSIPRKSLCDADTSWHTLYIISYKGRPIGMTSPSTLVCTGIEYVNAIDSDRVAWFGGKRLQDPIRFLSQDNMMALFGWAGIVREKLLARDDLNQELRKNIVTQLDIFVHELQAALGDAARPMSLSNHRLGMSKGVFTFIDYPVARPDRLPIEESDVLLIPTEGKKPTKNWLIVEKSLPQQWETEAKKIKVIDAFTIANYDYLIQDRQRYAQENIEIKTSGDLFTKRLVLVRQTFPGIYAFGPTPLVDNRGDFVTPLIPLTAELLQHISPEKLAKQITYERQHNGVVVKLQLPLKKGNVTMERLYEEPAIDYLNDVPILELWPYLLVPDWKVYYLYASYTVDPSETFEVKPIIEAETTFDHRRHAKGAGITFMEVYKIEHFPEALACYMHDKGFVGLICVKKPRLTTTGRDTKWLAAIDLGP